MTNQEFVALLKKNPISIGCGVLALALGAGLYVRSDRLPEATAQLEQVSSEGQRLAINIKNSAQLDEQAAAVAAADREIDPRLVRPGELAKNLQFFYRLETETATKLLDLRQNSVSARAAAAKTAYIGVGYSVSVEGEYLPLLEFLRRLEGGPVYCRVLTANIARMGGDLERSGPLKLDLSLELLGKP